MEESILKRAKALRRRLNLEENRERESEEGYGGLVTFGVVRESGSRKCIGGPCHAELSRISWDKPLAVVSLIDYTNIKEVREKLGYTIPFYRWLLNDSIYRDCFVTKSPLEAIRRGVICRTDLPSNLLLGALIATRYPWEYGKSNFLAWCEFYRRGVNPSMAFVLCHSYLKKWGEEDVSFQGELLGHNSISLTSMGEEGLRAFLKGDRYRMLNPTSSLYKNNRYKWVTHAWEDWAGEISLRTTISRGFKESVRKGRKRKGLLGAEGPLYVRPNLAYNLMAPWAIEYYHEVVG